MRLDEPAESGGPVRLSGSEWRERARAHAERADALTAGWRSRQGTGQRHPIEDFLFTYYSYRPALLRRWHPGAGVVLADAAAERGGWKHYRVLEGPAQEVEVDADAIARRHGEHYRAIARLLRATAARPARFGCFGLHEWAMVYRQSEQELRHGQVPLRLSRAQTDAVVESHQLACTHFDAFRFFTPEAKPLNPLQPSRETQPLLEQSGCLHAGMDLYKWAVKLGPLAPGELLLDCFELARDIRRLDMQASPYDVRAWGAEPVPIETAEGKAEYVRRQRGFAARGDALRERLLAALAQATPLPYQMQAHSTIRT